MPPSSLTATVLIFGLLHFAGNARGDDFLEVRMPFSRPVGSENYLCTPFDLRKNSGFFNASAPVFVTGFETVADDRVAHHVILYGCKHPGRRRPIFNCGEMERKKKKKRGGRGRRSSGPCASGATILYAWTSRADPLRLPEDVAFRVAGSTGIDWLVLQVHYATDYFVPSYGDNTTVVLTATHVSRPKRAGVLLMATSGYLPPKEETKMEVSCKLDDLRQDQALHPIAFRVHTHLLGRSVQGWKVTGGGEEWNLLGEKNPQRPQMFYPVEEKKGGRHDKSLVVGKGDVLAARCTMYNWREEAVRVGPSSDDEMCNFYLMYWVAGDELPRRSTCWSAGPPFYSLAGRDDPENRRYGAGLKNVPR